MPTMSCNNESLQKRRPKFRFLVEVDTTHKHETCPGGTVKCDHMKNWNLYAERKKKQSGRTSPLNVKHF